MSVHGVSILSSLGLCFLSLCMPAFFVCFYITSPLQFWSSYLSMYTHFHLPCSHYYILQYFSLCTCPNYVSITSLISSLMFATPALVLITSVLIFSPFFFLRKSNSTFSPQFFLVNLAHMQELMCTHFHVVTSRKL